MSNHFSQFSVIVNAFLLAAFLSPGALLSAQTTPPLYFFADGQFTSPPDWWEVFTGAIEAHDKGVEGDSVGTDQAINALEELHQKHGDSALIMAYLGSAFTLRARDAPLWRKQHWVNRGFTLLDAAVEREVENPLVRLVRAINSYHMPRFLDREDVAAEDFKYLLEWLENQRGEIEIPEAFRKAVYFHAGAYFLRQRESRSVNLLRRAQSISAAPHLDAPIRQSLQQAERRFPHVPN